MSAEIDGAPVRDLAERFHVQSTAFGFTLPADNLLKATTGNPYAAGAYFPSVDDGFYLMVAPLPPGHHTIHFHGIGTGGFTLDVIYHLAVQH